MQAITCILAYKTAGKQTSLDKWKDFFIYLVHVLVTLASFLLGLSLFINLPNLVKLILNIDFLNKL